MLFAVVCCWLACFGVSFVHVLLFASDMCCSVVAGRCWCVDVREAAPQPGTQRELVRSVDFIAFSFVVIPTIRYLVIALLLNVVGFVACSESPAFETFDFLCGCFHHNSSLLATSSFSF